jgi:hypothetical protein
MASATPTRLDWAAVQRARLAAVPASTWAKLALGAVCALALAAYLAFPTYPTYDSLYALLWGRDLLHSQLPDLHVYRAPTEHPLALAFGALCSLFGQGGARLVVLGAVASFVALVAGTYRLARLCFGPAVAAVAGALVLSRLFIENLALQGYLDVTYAALVVWAAALELERPRRGWPVLALLSAAGLLRPEAWLLSGAYWLWCVWCSRSTKRVCANVGRPVATRDHRIRFAQLVLIAFAPALWLGLDALLTGDPLYSLRSTAGLAQRLGRAQGLTGVISSTWTYTVRIDKLPVVLGAIAGALAALRIAPRRAVPPLALLGWLLAAFVIEGAAGASVLDRYMVAAAIALLPFCALALGGWSLLARGALARRAWMGAAAALLVFGVLQVDSTLSLSQLRDTLAYHEQLDRGLSAALRSPTVERSLRHCPLLSLPNNKLIPDARWMLSDMRHIQGATHIEVIARSEARELSTHGSPHLKQRLRVASVAVYPLPVTHFFDVVAGVGEESGAKRSPPGFRRIYASRSYAVYANC